MTRSAPLTLWEQVTSLVDMVRIELLKNFLFINEPCREKTGFLHMRKTKTQNSFAVTAKLISAFVFAT